MIKEECKKCPKVSCRLHPEYKARNMPKCNCKECWKIWENKQNEQK